MMTVNPTGAAEAVRPRKSIKDYRGIKKKLRIRVVEYKSRSHSADVRPAFVVFEVRSLPE